MAKDYTGWGGRKKRLEDLRAKKEAAQKPDKIPKKKGKKTDTVKHRLDEMENMVCDMARYLEAFMNIVREDHPELFDGNAPRKWWMYSYKIPQSKKLLAEAEKVIEKAIEREESA